MSGQVRCGETGYNIVTFWSLTNFAVVIEEGILFPVTFLGNGRFIHTHEDGYNKKEF